MTQSTTHPAPAKPTRFLDSLMAVRANSAQTRGQLGVTEFWGAQGHGSPLMIHSREDEGYLVVEGELTFWMDDDKPFTYGPGGFAWFPQGVKHAYAVSSPTARFLCMTTPAGLEEFFGSVGRPADGGTLPAGGSATEEEAQKVMSAAADSGVNIVGPPPGA
jgi:quercetin dioxygenase-like cupin family protein